MNRLWQKVGLVFLCGFAVLVAAPAPHASAWSEQEYRFLSHGWVEKYGQHLIVIDEWEPDFGVALPKKTIKAAWELARRSKADGPEREKAVAELLRAQGYYVMSH
jgi:hypothetical protein